MEFSMLSLEKGSIITGDLLTAFNEEERWLEVIIDDPSDTTPSQILSPRQKILSVPYSIRSSTAANADDVNNKDINPASVTITGFGPVIDTDGKWVGDPTDLKGPTGSTGTKGATGPQGPAGPKGDSGDFGCSWETWTYAYHQSKNGNWSEASFVPVTWLGVSNSFWNPWTEAGRRLYFCVRWQ